MEPFERLTGIAVPYPEDDVDTDRIAPLVPEALTLHPDYARVLFARTRRRADGSEDPEFVLNRPQFRAPSILVTGKNFGCGSSREAAVWALAAVGIRCVVAHSLADLFRENCLKNGVLPIALADPDAGALEAEVARVDGGAPYTVDLRAQRISSPQGRTYAFEIAAAERTILLEGLDDVGLTLKHLDAIVAWEERTRARRPWLQISDTSS